MPLMAHKDNGFKSASSSEVAELQKAGWELCDDPIEYKQRVWGIGVKVEVPAPVAIAEEPATLEPESTERKRPGRPRKAEQEPTVQDQEPEQNFRTL